MEAKTRMVSDINVIPDAHIHPKKHPPMMLTTDLSLRMDPKYGPISKKIS